MHSLEQELIGYGMAPSSSRRRGLLAAAKILEDMAEGSAKPQVYLSSLDPGVGKTLLIRHVLKALLSSSAPEHEGVAAIVCFPLLEEVLKMKDSLKDHGDEVSIWTGDEATNAQTATAPSQSRILLTTQKKMEAVCRRHDRFDQVRGFHYCGRPRAIRIWDESLLVGTETTLSEADLHGLLAMEPLRRQAPRLCAALKTLQQHLEDSPSDTVCAVPSLEEMAGPDEAQEVYRLMGDPSKPGKERDRLELLAEMADSERLIVRDNFGDAKLVGYRMTLPEDLSPLLVLDASGRCRATYHFMESVHRLPSGVKSYENLKIFLWQSGSGKASHLQDEEEKLVRGVAEAVLQRPQEDWLIVLHKDLQPRFRDRLEAHLGGRLSGALHLLTWGRHHGTNDFAHVPNVILASLLQLPPEVHTSRVRLSAGMSQTAQVSEAQSREMALGEMCHNVLQAVCRMKVRKLQQGGTCPPCRAYIIAAKQTGLREALPKLFPGCQLKRWTPSGATKLSGNIRSALQMIDQWSDEGFGDEITYKELAKAMGKDKKDFTKQVARDDRFREEVSRRGYVEAILHRDGTKGRRELKGIVLDETFPADPSTTYTP
ncbi:hypothetical protein [Pseudooceanicola marinus]|uniref:hypothetical protein n=1 Tax=Pseudooceanicola marinus TaxID=396013 RepID=UPI001CD6C024|nr:hypothetical protein [Pseudooceanicola marinus]MCA1338294.1 hypothetical protein [Pseudooceanicola marinus]